MKAIKTTATVAMVVAAGLVLSGCPASMSGSAYSRDQARQAQEVQLGRVQSVRQVMIEGTKSGVGAVSGAALGGLAGSAIEEGVTRQPGLEITVRLDNGRTLAVTQAADEPFYVGDRVQVLTSYDGTARVTHY